MSRYLILVLLNIPLVVAAILNTVISFKLGHLSLKRFVIKTSFWIVVLVALISTDAIYTTLYSKGLTQTEPLSLFDVLQITGVIYVFYLVNRLYVRVDVLERKFNNLHRQISIDLSKKKG